MKQTFPHGPASPGKWPSLAPESELDMTRKHHSEPRSQSSSQNNEHCTCGLAYCTCGFLCNSEGEDLIVPAHFCNETITSQPVEKQSSVTKVWARLDQHLTGCPKEISLS
ncbi:hypothetical protein ElyMa_006041300 [Elysia marginata]|uniref:Uncharacterized protein n=1 Tax=Elysia marginata TaxID=1093978 RepID=A0AAV4GMU1_9GAST|nr:hypothetical protein ElyMa_006041300 [Elysia marginata]